MKRNRSIPFGYEIQNGTAVVNAAEAKAVGMIYELYADGVSYSNIAARMTAKGITYHEGAGWNKHMIKRILENARYTGTDGYPAIICCAMQERVSAVKAANPHCKPLARKQPETPETDNATFHYELTATIRRLNNEINRALEKSADNPEQVKNLIFSCAAEKYASLIGVKQHG